VSCALRPKSRERTPKRGARCADACGRFGEGNGEGEDEAEDFANLANSPNKPTSSSSVPSGTTSLKLLSQIPSNALPCAMLARRPTVHMTLASSASSMVMRELGHRWEASTKGRVVREKEDSERVRNVGKDDGIGS
jgi:hypothetical protein